ncbi:MAG: hypothetical protein KGH95_01830 [Thaumarchaeota archaeon]|nr:hypothetical protein [Nitrososphaerota archaeon]
MKLLVGAIFGFFLLLLPSIAIPASQGAEWDQKLVPEDSVVLQKNVISMHIPGDSKLPFAAVWGTVQNPAPGYPVVIQIYQNGKPVYFAQTDVKSDGSYEKYFRVLSIDNDKTIHIFQGDYTVNIYKAVLKSTTGSTST